MTDIRYPIGKFDPKESLSEEERRTMIDQIAAVPAHLRAAVLGLDDQKLDVPYREGGWTCRQMVHHLPDSHMNAYVRFKLALTESQPAVKAYRENLWAELADSKSAPVEISLTLLEAIHERWTILMRSLKPEDFSRTILHPERGIMKLDHLLQIYSWHGRHHVAHIVAMRQHMGWS